MRGKGNKNRFQIKKFIYIGMDNSEINFIRDRILMKKEQMVREGLTVPEDRELIKEAIEERIEESLKEYTPSTAKEQDAATPAAPAPAVSGDDIGAQQKIDELITIALDESIPKAVSAALKTGNAFLIDKLHDTLIDKYYQQLKDQKVI